MARLVPGDAAPPFELRDQTDVMVGLSDFWGRKVLVYFYPQADTTGCAAQACAVRDAKEDLSALDIDVVGISPDEPEAQAAFDRKYSLGFPLLSDPDHAVAEAWSVWGERVRSTGERTIGIVRSSFLVDGEGRIERAWYEVTPGDTVPNVLEAISASYRKGRALEPIRRGVVVRCSVEDAFRVFTDGMTTWWPLETHSRAASEALEGVEAERVEVEGRVGGHIVEHLSNGEQLTWGEVVEWEPPRRIVIAWKPHARSYPPTEIEVTFTPRMEGTGVHLEHRGWERLGDLALDAHADYLSAWPKVFGRLYAAAANAAGRT
ncbi:MAG: thioredoxin-dependent thiol peroxidase [Actinomycetota bacterium]